MRSDANGGGSVYYEPNSFGGPTGNTRKQNNCLCGVRFGGQRAYDHNDHYTQAGDLYRLLSEEERTRLVDNIVGAMKQVKKTKLSFVKFGISIKQIRSTAHVLPKDWACLFRRKFKANIISIILNEILIFSGTGTRPLKHAGACP